MSLFPLQPLKRRSFHDDKKIMSGYESLPMKAEYLLAYKNVLHIQPDRWDYDGW